MISIRNSLFFLLVSVHLISAHYELTYPAPRGFDEAKEPLFPCGGFNNVGPYTEMPLNNPFVQIDSGHIYYSYTINAIVKNDPTESDFNSGYITVGSGKRNYPQEACLPINVSNQDSIKEGVNATIQIVYDGGDGLLYQCTDVTFTGTTSEWDNSQCKNADGSATFDSSQTPEVEKSEAALFTMALGITLFSGCLVSFVLI